MRHDDLGRRIKADYENRTRYQLPRRTYTILRIDGKSFHSYTRDCARPFDSLLIEDMDFTAKSLCEQIDGAQFAFVQSDEISILLTDFGSNKAEAWFDGNIQKLASISASIATAHFNTFRQFRKIANRPDGNEDDLVRLLNNLPTAYFDSRAFTIPDRTEVRNYFIWRQLDASKNSISMAAQACVAHDELQGKSSDQMQELLFQRSGINWNDYPAGWKRGRCVVPVETTNDIPYVDKRTGEEQIAGDVTRRDWQIVDPPIFTRDTAWIDSFIPRHQM